MEKQLRLYFSYCFLIDFAFIYAVYNLMFQLNGLSILDISILLSIWNATCLIIEIPSGVFSDLYNRRKLLLFGTLVKAGAFAIWWGADQFYAYALGFVLWGVQSALESGTKESLLYEILEEQNQLMEYEIQAGKARFYSNLGIGTSVIFGALIADYSINLCILLSVISVSLAVIPLLVLKDKSESKPTAIVENRFSFRSFNLRSALNTADLRHSMSQIFKQKTLMFLIGYSMVLVQVDGALDEYWQLYLDWLGIPIRWFGVAALIVTLGQSLGSRYAFYFQKIIPGDKVILWIALLASGFLWLSADNSDLYRLLFLIIFFLLTASAFVLLESQIQRQIKHGFRATIFSINSFIGTLFGLGYYLLFGFLAKSGGMALAFDYSAMLIALFSTACLLFYRPRKAQEA